MSRGNRTAPPGPSTEYSYRHVRHGLVKIVSRPTRYSLELFCEVCTAGGYRFCTRASELSPTPTVRDGRYGLEWEGGAS
jgi:hypothetical protein